MTGCTAIRRCDGGCETRRCTLSPLRPIDPPERGDARHGPNRPRRARPGELDRRQGIDDPEARGAAHEAAKQGAQFILFQELFYGPYFCQVQDAQYYSYTELIPDGPTTKRMQDLAKQTGMVVVAPMYEEDEKAAGHLLQHRGRHRRRRDVPRQVPQDPHPARQGLLGEVLLPAGQPRLPGLRDRGRQDRRLHLLRPPLPRRRPRARPQRRRDRAHPERDVARPVRVPVADRAGQPRRRQRLLRRDDQPGRHRGRLSATTTSTARATSSTRAASSSASVGSAHDEELIVRDLDLDRIMRGPQHLAVLPRPSTRRVRGPHAPLGFALPSLRLGRLEEDGRAASIPGAGGTATCSSASRSSPTTPPSGRSR